ncbi:MAG: hypothetical protein E6R03_09555 [Hyphomicrobiaceae bacterium]|nr:MAG: hypothetical protein E6R03_09555 [Hyphomicrobiaceae bacterium]
MAKTLTRLFATLLLAVLPVLGLASGGGWSGADRGDITRANPETYTWTVLAAATGNVADVIDMDTITATDWATGDTISASSVNPPNGVRTLCFRFVEASGTDAALRVRITGRDMFGRSVKSVLSFTSSGTLVTDAAYAPYPEPTFYVEYSTGLDDADSIFVYSYGQGLYSNPQAPNDVRSFTINGTVQTYTTANFAATSGSTTPSSSTAYFSTRFSSWNPATGSLPTAFLGTTTISQQVPLTSIRVWDAFGVNLATAATDDAGIFTGTLGTAPPVLTTSDAVGASVTQYGRFLYQLPSTYVPGGAVTLTAVAVATDAPTVASTLDFEVYESGAGSDICATAAQAVTAVSGTKSFTITPTNLVAGDWLDVRTTLALNDTGGSGAIFTRVGPISFTVASYAANQTTNAAGTAVLQLTPNTTSADRSTVVWGNGAGGAALEEYKSE